MSDWAIVVLTAVLVGVTAFYAWTNHGILDEMRNARAAALRPHLVLQLDPVGPMTVMVALVNVGPGSAIDIDITLRFNPAPGGSAKADERRWRGELLVAGERRQFLPPDEAPGRLMGIKQLAANYSSIGIAGVAKDVYDNKIAVRSEITDLAEWDRLLSNAQERLKTPAEERISKSLEKTAKTLDAMLNRWTARGRGLHTRSDADLHREQEGWLQTLDDPAPPPPTIGEGAYGEEGPSGSP